MIMGQAIDSHDLIGVYFPLDPTNNADAKVVNCLNVLLNRSARRVNGYGLNFLGKQKQ